MSRFTPLIQMEYKELMQKGGCFWCRKLGPVLKDCSDRKYKISSAASTLDKKSPSKIITAAQSMVQKTAISATKGLGAMLILDSVKEHLLMTTKLNKYTTKTLVD